MTCSFDKSLIEEFAIGEVTAGERREVEAHIAGCASCRLDVASHRQMARDLASLPDPQFPVGLEDVLIRASIQARRTLEPARAVTLRPARLRPAWVLGLGSLAGVGILVLLVILLWPGRLSTWGPVDKVVGGGVGQGVGLLDTVLRWFSDLRSGWDFAKDFLSRFAPVKRAAQAALGGVSGSVWAALVLGALGATLLLWRVTRTGQKRSVGHAKT